MKKFLKLIVACAMALTITACSSASGSDTITGTYSVNISGEDWGCGTNKAIISLDYVLDSVSKDDFVVTETKQATDYTDPNFTIKESTFDREVTDAYLCDEEGNKVEEASKYVALELYISPSDGSPVNYDVATGRNSWSDPYYLTIKTSDSAQLTSDGTEVTSFTVDTAMTGKTTSADAFEIKNGTYENVEYDYATYTPSEKSETLVVWLHGGGEGGLGDTELNTDPNIVLLANKVTALAGDDFQNTVGGANILVPQCPTYWIDVDGKNGGEWANADGTSYYTESLHALIADYAESVGATKIVIAGCSNGGYMTEVLAKTYGDEYQAYVPICGPLLSSSVSDEELNTMKSVPMYFIYSKDDDTVDPSTYEIPLIKRLQEAGATNLHVSTTDHVVDTSGNYKDEDGNAYQYSGHWSWIYFDNNESKCDDCSKDVFTWIAETIK